MKVHVIRRGIDRNLWKSGEQTPKQVAYCGYLEVNNPMDIDLWDLCNWSCWSDGKPVECEHLLITHCNSDVAYLINGEWYSHGMKKFDNFNHCYRQLIGNTCNDYFSCLWPIDYGFTTKDIQIITPETINNIIK